MATTFKKITENIEIKENKGPANLKEIASEVGNCLMGIEWAMYRDDSILKNITDKRVSDMVKESEAKFTQFATHWDRMHKELKKLGI